MRICYLADAPSIHTQRWCIHFAMRGHEVHLISFREAKIALPENCSGTLTVHTISAGQIAVAGGNWRVVLQVPKIRKLLRQIRPDVLHAMYATSYGLVAALAGVHPLVVTPLGTDVLISGKQSRLYRMLLRYVFRKADALNTQGEHVIDEMVSIGADPKKIELLVFGTNPDTFHANGRKTSDVEFIVTHTRNFEPVYNIGHFIKAAALAAREIPTLRLRLTGDGSLRQDMEKLAHELKIADKIDFLGRVAPERMAALLRETHVFVSVSLSDGNNISLNEAMACGAFCMATDIPANRVWITDGENGFLVKIDDVETLAKRLVEAYQNYEVLAAKAQPISHAKIQEKGLWPVNMEKMEKK
ncbi:MAG: glycosyltransferase, partial [Bacteroidia bacterium]